MKDYVNRIGVQSIKNLNPPGKWKNVTDNRGTDFPVFSHDEEWLSIIVGVNVGEDTFIVSHKVGGDTTFSSPLFTASTDSRCADKLRQYMKDNP